jgi:hypothetical protein
MNPVSVVIPAKIPLMDAAFATLFNIHLIFYSSGKILWVSLRNSSDKRRLFSFPRFPA